MSAVNSKLYPEVGRCIYCGATGPLGNEHIVPYALGGTLILPKASCLQCTRTTGDFEGKVLRENTVRAIRRFRGLSSRSKHVDAPASASMLVTWDTGDEAVELDIDHAPLLMHFPRLEPPGHLGLTDYQSGVGLLGYDTIAFGPSVADTLNSLGGSAALINATMHPGPFARMIAKIAYSYAFAEGILEYVDGPPMLLGAILGESDDIGRWVGTLSKPNELHPDFLHRIQPHLDYEKGLLIVEVQVFSDSQTPSYGVIVGRLKPRSPV